MAEGKRGRQGVQGIQGIEGEVGPSTRGEKGEKGDDGRSTSVSSTGSEWLGRIVGAVGAILVLAVFIGAQVAGNFVDDVKSAEREFSEKAAALDREIMANRAIGCELKLAIGIRLRPDGPCLKPGVVDLYDASTPRIVLTVEDGMRLLQLQCRVLGVHDRSDPACSG